MIREVVDITFHLDGGLHQCGIEVVDPGGPRGRHRRLQQVNGEFVADVGAIPRRLHCPPPFQGVTAEVTDEIIEYRVLPQCLLRDGRPRACRMEVGACAAKHACAARCSNRPCSSSFSNIPAGKQRMVLVRLTWVLSKSPPAATVEISWWIGHPLWCLHFCCRHQLSPG